MKITLEIDTDEYGDIIDAFDIAYELANSYGYFDDVKPKDTPTTVVGPTTDTNITEPADATTEAPTA